MALTVPPPINPAPPAPDRANRSTFAALAQAFTIWMTQAFPQIAAIAVNVYNNAIDAFNYAQSAQSSAAFAQQLVAEAVSASSAQVWSAATNYATGATVRSPTNLALYTRKTPGGVNATEPSTDATETFWFRTPTQVAMPPKQISADYSLVLTDGNTLLVHPTFDVTARTITIPANSAVAFAPGTTIPILNEDGAGTLTIAITAPDVLRWIGPGNSGSRTLASVGMASLIKINATEWFITGTNVT